MNLANEIVADFNWFFMVPLCGAGLVASPFVWRWAQRNYGRPSSKADIKAAIAWVFAVNRQRTAKHDEPPKKVAA